MAFYVPICCVTFARYCGKMYSRHLFPYGGLKTVLKRLHTDTLSASSFKTWQRLTQTKNSHSCKTTRLRSHIAAKKFHDLGDCLKNRENELPPSFLRPKFTLIFRLLTEAFFFPFDIIMASKFSCYNNVNVVQ